MDQRVHLLIVYWWTFPCYKRVAVRIGVAWLLNECVILSRSTVERWSHARGSMILCTSAWYSLVSGILRADATACNDCTYLREGHDAPFYRSLMCSVSAAMLGRWRVYYCVSLQTFFLSRLYMWTSIYPIRITVLPVGRTHSIISNISREGLWAV